MKPILSLLLLIPLFVSAQTHVCVRSQKNFSQKADSILRLAIPLVDSVINTTTFREGILKAKFLGHSNLTNKEILELLMTGKEVCSANPNDTVDLRLETYPDQVGDNIGTTFQSERIVSSEAYILRNGARCYAAHLIHEYVHTIGKGSIGFEHRHQVTSTSQRREKCQSVPYLIGDLARQILGIKTCHFECENFVQKD